MSKVRLICLVSVLILLGCNKKNYLHELEGEFEEATVKVRLMESKTDSFNNYSTIYGSIIIKSKSKKLEYVNLNCFQLALNEDKTDHIYINSLAHFNSEMIRPNDAGIVEYSTYWTINKTIGNDQLVQFLLDVHTVGKNCINYLN